MQHPIDVHRGKRVLVAEREVADSAALDLRGVALHHFELRAGLLLELRESAGVVVVRVRIEQDLHVLRVEPELADVGDDLRRRFLESAVEHDVSFRGRDEKRGDLVGADVIEVADHTKRLDRLVPLRHGGGQQKRTERHAFIVTR